LPSKTTQQKRKTATNIIPNIKQPHYKKGPDVLSPQGFLLSSVLKSYCLMCCDCLLLIEMFKVPIFLNPAAIPFTLLFLRL